MLAAVDGELSALPMPTETITAPPSSLKAAAPILTSVGLEAEAIKVPTHENGDSPDRQHIREHLQSIRAGIVREARSLAERNAESVTALARLAQAEHNCGNLEEAVAAARKCIDISLGHARGNRSIDTSAVHVALGVLAATGHASEAEGILSTLALDNTLAVRFAALASERGDYALALDRLDGVRGESASMLRAYVLLKLDRPHLALAEMRRIQREGHTSPALVSNMAYSFALLGSTKKAIRAAMHAVSLAPLSERHSFNLVGYLLSANDLARADAELDRLRRARGGETAEMVMARASVRIAAGQPDKALRRLLEADKSFRVSKTSKSSALLRTNIAVLKARLNRSTREEAFVEISRCARLAAGRSLGVIEAFCDFAPGVSAAADVERLVNQAAEWHDPSDMLSVRARHAYLMADFDQASRLAIEWARVEPLNWLAVTHSLFMESVWCRRYSAAAERGLASLVRFKSNQDVINNVAYALAMAGRSTEALELVRQLSEDDPVHVATFGLALLASGEVQQGLRMYRSAFEIAGLNGDSSGGKPETIRPLIALNLRIVLKELQIGEDLVGRDVLPVELPDDWNDSPTFLLYLSVAERLNAWVKPA